MINTRVNTGIVDEQRGKLASFIARFLAVIVVLYLAIAGQLKRRVKDFSRDLSATWSVSHAQGEVVAMRFVGYRTSANPQAGYSILGVLLGAGGTIIGLMIFLTVGVPKLMVMSANATTALTTAGASAEQIQGWIWGTWLVILIIIVGTVVLIVRKYAPSTGGGGGGGGRRGRRR